MGAILILLSIFVSVNGFIMGVETIQQQTVQYLTYVCGTILFSSGFLSLIIQYTKKANYSDELEKITKSLKIISDHYTVLENERRAEVAKIQRQAETKKEEIRLKNISSYDGLLNDPEIKEGAALMLKMYGTEAHERYLQDKMKEFNVKK